MKSLYDTMQNERRENLILLFCKTPKARYAIQNYVKIKNREYFRKIILNPLVKSGKLLLTMIDKPRSKNQKYVTK
jgi:ATP-dependent DNA helicase RecG